MATKLKNLKVKKVDFVDDGANPDADIKLFKRNDTGDSGISTDKTGEKGSGVWKRLLGFIGKAAGMNQEEIDGAMEEIRKGDSVSFKEKIKEVKNRKIADEIWDTCYALQSSLCSILNDEEMDGTNAAIAMQESLDDFCTVVQECITQWSTGKESSIVTKNDDVTETDLEVIKSAVFRLNKSIEKASVKKEVSETNHEELKGEADMKIDKSKLTDAERAFLDSVEKRYGAEEAGIGGSAVAPISTAEPNVTKTAQQQEAQSLQTGNEDIYKGIHPAVRAELEQLKKFREATEDKELYEVAKRYAIIGKTEDELVPILKSLKSAGGTSYNDMLAVLDQTVSAVEKSGLFAEVGKSGHASTGENSVEAKISGIAKGYMEKEPAMDYSAAVAKAWEDNLELVAEYEEEAGF